MARRFLFFLFFLFLFFLFLLLLLPLLFFLALSFPLPPPPSRLLFANREKGICGVGKTRGRFSRKSIPPTGHPCTPISKELTEGHEQSRNEAREGVGTPLISWLAASTSIFRRSNNGCNVPLKIHLVIGGVVVVVLSLLFPPSPLPFFSAFFWVQLKWLLSDYWGRWYKWYWFYFVGG